MCQQIIIDYKMDKINMSHDFFKILPTCHDLRLFKMDDVHFFRIMYCYCCPNSSICY